VDPVPDPLLQISQFSNDFVTVKSNVILMVVIAFDTYLDDKCYDSFQSKLNLSRNIIIKDKLFSENACDEL
jgi:hypothetical protein